MLLKESDEVLHYVRWFWGERQTPFVYDEDGLGEPINSYYPEMFAYTYDSIIESIPFKRKDFDKHERLQELINEFGLNMEQFWFLVLYLYDFVSEACKNQMVAQPSTEDCIKELKAFTDSNKLTSITLEAGKNKLTITDPVILKYLDFSFDYAKLSPMELSSIRLEDLKPMEKADARRKTSYFFASQLASFLQIEKITHIKRRENATISNKEKELILCLLYVCRFADNPENYLELGYYNKLMKDFAGSEMNPFSEKYV